MRPAIFIGKRFLFESVRVSCGWRRLSKSLLIIVYSLWSCRSESLQISVQQRLYLLRSRQQLSDIEFSGSNQKIISTGVCLIVQLTEVLRTKSTLGAGGSLVGANVVHRVPLFSAVVLVLGFLIPVFPGGCVLRRFRVIPSSFIQAMESMTKSVPQMCTFYYGFETIHSIRQLPRWLIASAFLLVTE